MDQVTTKICIDFPEGERHMCHKRHTMPRRGERLYPCPLYTPESTHERSPVALREKLQNVKSGGRSGGVKCEIWEAERGVKCETWGAAGGREM